MINLAAERAETTNWRFVAEKKKPKGERLALTCLQNGYNIYARPWASSVYLAIHLTTRREVISSVLIWVAEREIYKPAIMRHRQSCRESRLSPARPCCCTSSERKLSLMRQTNSSASSSELQWCNCLLIMRLIFASAKSFDGWRGSQQRARYLDYRPESIDSISLDYFISLVGWFYSLGWKFHEFRTEFCEKLPCTFFCATRNSRNYGNWDSRMENKLNEQNVK